MAKALPQREGGIRWGQDKQPQPVDDQAVVAASGAGMQREQGQAALQGEQRGQSWEPHCSQCCGELEARA